MSFTSARAWRFAIITAKCGFIFGSVTYLYQFKRAMRTASTLQIKDTEVASESFTESRTIRDYVNPQGKSGAVVDTHSVTLQLPIDKGVSDETILAQATKKFFNGWVFYPESLILKTIGLEDSPSSKLASTTVPHHVWNAAELSESALPDLHTVIFGAFRVADIHLADAPRSGAPSSGQSHVDFVFGSDMSNFAGCHRLSVERKEPGDGADETASVHVQLQCYACNPQSDQPAANSALLMFHRLYASLLFKETAGRVNEWMHPKDTVPLR